MLEHPLVERAGINAGKKVFEIGKRSVCLALGDNFLRGLFADSLNARQSESDARSQFKTRNSRDRRVDYRSEHFTRLIDVRSEHFKPHRFALRDEVRNFFRVA